MSRNVRIATVIWAGSILLSRVIGIIREAAIGRTLGTGPDADAYAAAFIIPDFLNYLLAGGVLSIVFIPIFEAHMARGDEDAGWGAFSVIANFLIVALVVLSGVFWFLTPSVVPLIAPGFPPDQLERLSYLTRIILPAQLFIFVGGLLSAVLQARDQHGLPALAPLLYSGAITVFGFALGPSLGAEGFAWGVLVGAVLGPFALPLYGCLRGGLRWRPIFSFRHPDFRRYLWNSLPIMLAFSVVVLDEMVIKRFGSLLGAGTVAQLQYARTLMKVPMGVFGVASGVAAYPTVARLVARGELDAAWKTLVDATRLLLVLALTAQAALTVAGTEVATVIYGARQIAPEALEDIGLYTGLMCLGLGAWSAQTVLSRGYYAMERNWAPSLLGTAVMVTGYPLYGLMGAHFGAVGLCLASSAAILLYVGLLSVGVRRAMVADRPAPRFADVGLKMTAGVVLGVAAGLGLEAVLPPLPALVRGGLSGGLAAGVCLGTGLLLGVPEVNTLLQKVKRRLLRSRGAPST